MIDRWVGRDDAEGIDPGAKARGGSIFPGPSGGRWGGPSSTEREARGARGWEGLLSEGRRENWREEIGRAEAVAKAAERPTARSAGGSDLGAARP